MIDAKQAEAMKEKVAENAKAADAAKHEKAPKPAGETKSSEDKPVETP